MHQIALLLQEVRQRMLLLDVLHIKQSCHAEPILAEFDAQLRSETQDIIWDLLKQTVTRNSCKIEHKCLSIERFQEVCDVSSIYLYLLLDHSEHFVVFSLAELSANLSDFLLHDWRYSQPTDLFIRDRILLANNPDLALLRCLLIVKDCVGFYRLDYLHHVLNRVLQADPQD